MVNSPCTEISELEDFGLLLGSLNKTDHAPEFDGEEGKAKEVHRGPAELEVHDSPPMFFRIPFQSGLIPGDRMNLDKDVCYLSISGFIPDGLKTAVLGQPFLQNYYVVLDQDDM